MAGNGWSGIQEATGNLGEALMRIAMMSDDRRYRAEQLARQGRYDDRAEERIGMDEQMLAQSVLRTAELTRQGGTRDARAAAGVAWERGREGYTPDLGDEGGTMAEFLTGLGQGTPQDWKFDAETSETYLDRGAANTQAQAQARALAGIETEAIGTRASTLGEQGWTVGGQPLPEDRGGPESRAGMFEAGGRWFKDDPVGRAEGIAWLEEIEGVGGVSNMFSPEVMDMMRGGGGRPDDEGGNFFSKVRGWLGGGGEEEGPMLTPGQGGAQGMGVGEPIGAPGDGVTQDQIDQLREMGFTEDQIREWLSTR